MPVLVCRCEAPDGIQDLLRRDYEYCPECNKELKPKRSKRKLEPVDFTQANLSTLDICDKLMEIEKVFNEYDDELAATLEGELYFEFVKTVANHGETPLNKMAKMILKSRELEIDRYRNCCD